MILTASEQTWVDFTVITSGICWTITYIALVYRGFKDKSYGMPLIPLALNIAWEITFSVIYPPHSMGIAAKVINTLWMICDVGIVATYFLYGYRSFEKNYKISKELWIFISIFSFAVSMGIMVSGGPFFGQFEKYFHGDTFEGAKFIAFLQNLIMSINFIFLFWERRSSEGQSFTIAWTKWLGTSMTVGNSYLLVEHKGEETNFMLIIITTIFILDLYYMQMIYSQLKKEKINPLLRL